MAEINFLQRGNVYFFYRPKVKKGGVQRFFLTLHPEKQDNYYLLIIGKKHLPAEKGRSYFALLETIKKSKNDLLEELSEKQKVNYSDYLQKNFANYRFIPLNPVDFLDYEGTELLLIPKIKESLAQTKKEVTTCLNEVPFEDLLSEFARMTSPKTITP